MAIKMNKTQVILIVALLAILSLSYILDSGNRDTPSAINKDNNTKTIIPTQIEVTSIFENGIYKYDGVIELPTPCYDLETKAVVKESYPEQVTLEFDLKKTSNSKKLCIQTIDKRPFRIIFQASKNAIINARVNGTLVKLIINKKKNETR